MNHKISRTHIVREIFSLYQKGIMKFNTRSTTRSRFVRASVPSLVLLAVAFVAFAQNPVSAAANTFAGTNPNIQEQFKPSATVLVTTTANSGVGSLRSALVAANPGDTINFSLTGCPCVITLSSELVISQSLDIVGLGQSMLAVNGNNSVRVFNNISPAPVTISSLTIQNGSVSSGNSGGGIRTQSAITFNNVTFSGNNGGLNGGGIYN